MASYLLCSPKLTPLRKSFHCWHQADLWLQHSLGFPAKPPLCQDQQQRLLHYCTARKTAACRVRAPSNQARPSRGHHLEYPALGLQLCNHRCWSALPNNARVPDDGPALSGSGHIYAQQASICKCHCDRSSPRRLRWCAGHILSQGRTRLRCGRTSRQNVRNGTCSIAKELWPTDSREVYKLSLQHSLLEANS